MPELPPLTVESLLWGAAALVAVWIVGPLLLMALGLTRVGFRIVGGPEALEPAGDDPQYAYLFEQLRDLGFEPLGARQEIGWFSAQHWYKSFPPGRVFASRAGDCFVTLYRIFAGQPWRLSFHTVFTDGSLLSTANQMPNFRVDMPGYYRWAHVTADLADLLAMHREAAENYRADHRLTVASPDLEGACAAVARASQRYLRSRGAALALAGLTAPVLIGVLLTALIGLKLGFDRWPTAAAFILAAVSCRVLLREGVRESAHKSWNEDRERGLAEQWQRDRDAALSGLSRGRPSDAVTPAEPRPSSDDRLTDDPPRR